MGTKAQRQNQHVRRLMMKIARFEKKGWSTKGLRRELGYCTGEFPRPPHKTGSEAAPSKKLRR